MSKPVTFPALGYYLPRVRAPGIPDLVSRPSAMSNHTEGHPQHPFRNGLEHMAARERRIVEAVLHRRSLARDVHQDSLDQRTFGERMADRIAAFGGSWPFIGPFGLFLAGWIVLNSVLLARRDAWDPYPYILLNLLLSTLAALQAPAIMMAQNRQAARDRLKAANDYEVNLKAEVEIRGLHDKLDALREADRAELVRLQQVQIHVLERLLASVDGRGGAP